MGKIRVKTFDESNPEEDAKQKAKKMAKRAEKKAAKAGTDLSTEPEVIEELNTPTPVAVEESIAVEAAPEKKEAKKAKKEKFVKVRAISKRHKENAVLVSKSSVYPTDKALEALRKFKVSKFDETVELHVNTKEKGVSGQVVLPHGTGKTLRIKVADDALIAEVEKGKINFDVLVAQPSMMPKLAKVARVLGPRGLMPNPKNGTITENTDEAIKKLSAGQVSYKTESQAPIIHVSVGKMSFDDKKLTDNMKAMLSSIGGTNIKNVTLKSTMSPAIRLDYTTLAK